MLKVRVDLKDDVPSFFCPFCGIYDAAYIATPTSCWGCGKIYIFDILKLKENIDDRYIYYKYGKA